MALSESEELELLELEELEKSQSSSPEQAPTYVQGMFKVYKDKPKGLAQKADVALAKTANTGINLLNVPFEAAGEAIAAPIEGRAAIRPTVLGGERPENPISVINKLLRAGGGAVSGIPGGTPLESARSAYNVDRGGLGVAEDTAMGLLMGKVAPAAVAAPIDASIIGATKAAKGAKSAISSVSKKAVRVGLGPTEEAQTILASRPQDVARQTNFQDLGDKFADTANQLSKKIGELDDAAWGTLLGLKAEPKSKLINVLRGVKSQFSGGTKISDADKAAVRQIEKYVSRIQSIKQKGATPGTEQFLDQNQLRDLVQSIRRDATYGLVKNEPVNRAVKAAAKGIDQYLKGENPDYEIAMKPVADATAAMENTIKRFRLERDPNGNYVPTTATISKLSSLPKEKNPEINRLVQDIRKVTGTDFMDEAKLTATKNEFTAGERSRGSARTAAGAGIGMLAESVIPGPPGIATGAGALIGRSMDYYGGPMAKSLIDILGRAKSGVGNVLSAVSPKAGSNYQALIQKLISENPVLLPLLQGNK